MSRYRMFGRLLLVSAAVIIIVAYGQLPGDNLFWGELQNSLHILLFCLLTLLMLRLLGTYPPLAHRALVRFLVVSVLLLVIALGSETIQGLSGRGFGKPDILRDLVGILLGLGLAALLERNNQGAPVIRRPDLRSLLVLLLTGLALMAGFPLGKLVLDYQARNQAFPVVLDLLADWSDSFIDYAHARPSTSACLPGMAPVELLPATYPGVSVSEPYPDWRAYRELVLSLHSQDPAPYEMVLRIHDRQHDHTYRDRYNRVLNVEYGTNHYRIPLAEISAAPAERTMRLGQVAGVILFAWNLPQARQICIGKIKLER